MRFSHPCKFLFICLGLGITFKLSRRREIHSWLHQPTHGNENPRPVSILSLVWFDDLEWKQQETLPSFVKTCPFRFLSISCSSFMLFILISGMGCWIILLSLPLDSHHNNNHQLLQNSISLSLIITGRNWSVKLDSWPRVFHFLM